MERAVASHHNRHAVTIGKTFMHATALRLAQDGVDESADLSTILDHTSAPPDTGAERTARPPDRRHRTYVPKEEFEQVVLPHLDAAYNVARWLMRDRVAADDVVQEAMLRALTYFPTFKGVNPRGWLLQIVRNTAYASVNHNRGVNLVPLRNERDEPSDVVAQLPSGDDDPETSLIRSRERERVRQMIAALPIELRDTLVLRELEELSYKEIADVTHTPIGTVMSRLWRARRLLAQAARRAEAA